VRLDAAQGGAARLPLVDVAQEHEEALERADVLQDARHLRAALARAQAEVRGDDAQLLALAPDRHVQRPARLAPGQGEVDAPHGHHRVAGEQRVAIKAPGLLQRGSIDDLVARAVDLRRAPALVERRRRMDLLQRHDVGVELFQDADHAWRVPGSGDQSPPWTL
jgi:hypothetical protein